jgi:hypothetical protein
MMVVQKSVVRTKFDIYVVIIFHLDVNYIHPLLNCRVLVNSSCLGG